MQDLFYYYLSMTKTQRIYTGCPKKNYQLGKMAVTTIFFGLFAFPRRVLKNSGSEDYKTVLTFQN